MQFDDCFTKDFDNQITIGILPNAIYKFANGFL
jgi:hypothetical protein